MGVTSGIVGAVGAGASLLGGSKSSSGGQPNVYIPQNQTQADATYTNFLGDMATGANGLSKQLLPAYQSYASNIQNNPYAAGAQGSANQISGLGQQAGMMDYNNAGALSSAANQGLPYASQILQQGFDPQNALYNRSVQQLQDQMGAGAAQSGLSGTPYAAGLQNQALGNFGIDWNAQKLANMNSGISGFSNLIGAIGGGQTTAGQNANTGLSTMTTAGQLPYQTYLGQQNDSLAALNSLSQGGLNAYALPQQVIGDSGNYLGLGNNATQTAGNVANKAFNQNQTMGSNVGSAISGLASNPKVQSLFDQWFGGSGSSGGSSGTMVA